MSGTKPYVCRVCGAEFSTQHVRCIGTDGTHRPTVVTARRELTRPLDDNDRWSRKA